MRTGKVYVIDPVSPRGQNTRTPGPTRKSAPSSGRSESSAGNLSLLAYLAGPVAVVFWAQGALRAVAGVISVAAITVGLFLITSYSQVAGWFSRLPHSVTVWLLAVPALLTALAVLWAIAIFHAGEERRRPAPGWMRRPWSVLVAGLVVPGLGLYLAGRTIRAAAAFLLVAPLTAAAIMLANWRWFWHIGETSASPGVAGRALETTFLAAAVVAAVSLLLWIVQALDGVRRVAVGSSRASSNALSLLLLIALVAAAIAFQPAGLASDLHSSAAGLSGQGLRLVPLVLCDAATTLDPVTPVYLADAALLNEALGMTEAAQAKRALLAERAQAYRAAMDADRAATLLNDAGDAAVEQPVVPPTETSQRTIDEKACLPLMNAQLW